MLNFLRKAKQKKIYYIVDGADWIISDIGSTLEDRMRSDYGLEFSTCTTVTNLKDGIVHFGGRATLLLTEKQELLSRFNKNILTWYHFDEQGKDRDYVQALHQVLSKIDVIHTTTEITKKLLVQNDVPEEKIRVIPLGIDTNLFSKPNVDKRIELRKKYQIPLDAFVIGSFQKDGKGWEEGLVPKLEKGPDIFCDVIEEINKKHDIFVLLSGPARGYVKNRLEKAGISYYHKFFEDPNDITEFYKIIDMYIVASRSEGGPMSVLQSLASGVPLVSTKVGVAPEVLRDGEFGLMSEVEDTKKLVEDSLTLMESSRLRELFSNKGIERIVEYSWERIAQRMYNELYKPFL